MVINFDSLTDEIDLSENPATKNKSLDLGESNSRFSSVFPTTIKLYLAPVESAEVLWETALDDHAQHPLFVH